MRHYRRFLLLLVLLLETTFGLVGYAQQVMLADSITKNPVCYATVYDANGTVIGRSDMGGCINLQKGFEYHIQAQQPSMQALIDQSLSKLQQPTPEAFLNCIAELKRIDAMFPDSIQPKYQMALQSLNFSVMNPHAPQTESLLAEAEQTITKMEQMNRADQSDICTLRGFLYMVRIVQDPARNGQRYYLDVMQNYEKALKLNSDNQLAKQLQQKFFEGMQQQTGK